MRALRPITVSFCALAAATAFAVPASAQAPGGASAETGPITLTTPPQGLVGRAKLFTGTAGRSAAGKSITIERFDVLSGQWAMLTRATIAEDGSFRARWKADRPGPARVRGRIDGTTATAASKPPEVAITLYRAGQATWYGPGFYGNKTACGQTMSRTLLGVAHKTMRCGTQVELLYRGRTLTVPVVDRGPYNGDFDWDLTYAASQQLGFLGSGTIGTLTRADRRRR